MKRTYEMLRNLLILVSALMALQIVLLIIGPDLKHIIFTCIAAVGFITIIVLFVIARLEINKIIFENKDEEYEIRVVDYDDYQLIRELLCEEPLSNSEKEVELLNEYEKITADLVRIRYHYVVFHNEKIIGLFYSKYNENKFVIEFKKIEEKEKIKELLLTISSKKNKNVDFVE